MDDDQEQRPDSLLPYDEWTMEALRQVVVRALTYAAEQGLPGEHHFYVTFRTDYPGVVMPTRLSAQYPQEMTIVLQHQFWDLAVDTQTEVMSVGLSFGGVPTTLRIPLAAITAFVDPHVRYGLRFQAEPAAAPPAQPEPEPLAEPEPGPEPEPQAKPEEPQVVSLDAFRRRTPPKE
jgi:hypothetical protein